MTVTLNSGNDRNQAEVAPFSSGVISGNIGSHSGWIEPRRSAARPNIRDLEPISLYEAVDGFRHTQTIPTSHSDDRGWSGIVLP
jgi:hypothetical protein